MYDRRHGAVLPEAQARKLATAAEIHIDARILDVGAGTGRVSIALGNLGYQVVAADPSQSMLQQLLSKCSGATIHCVCADGLRLPFPDHIFAACILSRLLYLIPDWPIVLREIRRVVRPGGMLLHEWGNGRPDDTWVQIREKLRSLFEAAGITNPFHPGARSEFEVDKLLLAEGWNHVTQVHFDPEKRMTLGEFIERINSGECSYIWNVPADVQQRCLGELNTWASNHFDLAGPFSQEIRWKIYRSTDKP